MGIGVHEMNAVAVTTLKWKFLILFDFILIKTIIDYEIFLTSYDTRDCIPFYHLSLALPGFHFQRIILLHWLQFKFVYGSFVWISLSNGECRHLSLLFAILQCTLSNSSNMGLFICTFNGVKMNIQRDAYVDIQKLIKTNAVYGRKNGNFLWSKRISYSNYKTKFQFQWN